VTIESDGDFMNIELPTSEIQVHSKHTSLPLVSASVGWDGAMLALYADSEDAAVAGASAGATPRSQSERPLDYRLVVTHHGWEAELEVAGSRQLSPCVQQLPDGRVLVVGPRCTLIGRSPEQNAEFHDPAAGDVRRAVFGDGIADVQVDGAGRIWVSYFDEGVFGNNGWGEGRPPIGAGGLLRFADDGSKVWELGDHAFVDCYAMNVASDGAWVCPYNSFDIIHARPDGPPRYWSNTVRGASGIVVAGDHVVLLGSYELPWTHGSIIRLHADGRSTVAGTMQIACDPANVKLAGCRGSRVYGLCGDVWHVGDIAEVLPF